MQNIITRENLTTSPIEAGDAGLVIKANGRIQIFNTFTPDQLAAMTPLQKETGKKLMALMTACAIPAVMDVLMQVASDPDVVGPAGIHLGPMN